MIADQVGKAASAPPRSLLVAASADGPDFRPLSKLHVLAVIGRRSLPSLIEATLFPAVLFYVCLVHFGPGVAMIAALSWSYGAIARRVLSGKPVPAVLVLAVLGLTTRTIFGVMSGTFIYFLQPVVTTLALSVVFLASLWIGRPIIGRLAHDFCPLSPEIASLPSIERLFAVLTVLWAGVHLVSAARDVRAPRQRVDTDVRLVEDVREPRDHHERDRAHRVVGDPHRSDREPGVRHRLRRRRAGDRRRRGR